MFGDIEDIKFSDHAVLDQIKFIKSQKKFQLFQYLLVEDH
ncbi:MAG: hypothetical protein CM15mP127_02940 [Gammaproteobacteria bacterium]|nr:MAG: hypothetical protein CM15mP127_02940 [Gammaproteobacteria bacterium]